MKKKDANKFFFRDFQYHFLFYKNFVKVLFETEINKTFGVTVIFKNSLKLVKNGLKLVYRYTCSNCKVTYYGKTYHHFFTRAVEHLDISNLTRKRLKCVKQLAISDHLLECNCSIEFDHFDILASNRFRLLIKESLLIKRDQPQLNKTIKSFPLKFRQTPLIKNNLDYPDV